MRDIHTAPTTMRLFSSRPGETGQNHDEERKAFKAPLFIAMMTAALERGRERVGQEALSRTEPTLKGLMGVEETQTGPVPASDGPQFTPTLQLQEPLRALALPVAPVPEEWVCCAFLSHELPHSTQTHRGEELISPILLPCSTHAQITFMISLAFLPCFCRTICLQLKRNAAGAQVCMRAPSPTQAHTTHRQKPHPDGLASLASCMV